VNRRPSTLEQYIGDRIRRRRIEIGLTQEELAAALGCSYQQIQKYESGANRVSAGNLLRLARRLDVPLDYFFLGWDEETGAGPAAERPQGSRHTVELVRSFESIGDPAVCGAVAALVRAVAERAVRTRPSPWGARARRRSVRAGAAAD
jgi:transcriptional regulator with XRE-family HTH domain